MYTKPSSRWCHQESHLIKSQFKFSPTDNNCWCLRRKLRLGKRERGGGGESNHRNCYVGRDNITLECVESQATTPWRRAWPPKFMIKQHRWRQLIIKPDARTVLCLHQSAGGYLWPAAVIGPAERISWIERISRRRLQFLRRPSTRRRWPAAPQLRECNQSDFWRRRRPAPQINLRGRRLFLAAIFRVPFVATKIHTPFLARPSDFSMISIVYSTQQLTKNGSIH